MTTIEVLGRQHQEVLARLADTELHLSDAHGAGTLAAFAAFLGGEVLQHFSLEEDALFPILARHLSLQQGPLAVMNIEHANFRELLDSLHAGVRSGDLALQRHSASEIIDLLRGHIAKEDNVLFPMASGLLSAEEQREVDARAAALAPSQSSLHA